jgi:rRNA-processing protein FCF1
MAEIVLDTNVFEVLLDGEFIEKVVEKCDHIFIPECVFREAKGRHRHLINKIVLNIVKIKNKFHKRNVRSKLLPDYLKRELKKCGAKYCDIQIASLAYERYGRSRQVVYLVSNDPHFQGIRLRFEEYGVNVRTYEEFRNEYLRIQ